MESTRTLARTPPHFRFRSSRRISNDEVIRGHGEWQARRVHECSERAARKLLRRLPRFIRRDRLNSRAIADLIRGEFQCFGGAR